MMGEDRCVILGAGGMLGRELVAACERRGLPVRACAGRRDLDVTNAEAVARLLADERPGVVFNAAGWSDVDGAEQDAAAWRVNAEAPGSIARACAAAGALLVHYSSDYVFDGAARRPYLEEDPTGPVNAYGRGKLAGERAVLAAGAETLVIRTSWLYASHGRNFVRTILELAASRPSLRVVDDQVGSPTWARDVAEATLALVATGARPGLLHVAGGGPPCSRFELAAAIVACAGMHCTIEACASRDVPRPARRPANTALDCSAAERIVGPMRPWKQALGMCLEEMAMPARGGSS